MDQRRRQDEIVAGDVEVHLLHQLDRFEVLRRDRGNRDVVDVELVLADQMQQEIERALELLELDRKGVGRRLEIV